MTDSAAKKHEVVIQNLDNTSETNASKRTRTISYLLTTAFTVSAMSWFYLLHFAPNFYQLPTTKTVGFGENIVFGILAAIFGPVLMMIEGLKIAPLIILLNSALTLILLLSGRYKSGSLMWFLTGALSYFTMFICMDDSSVRQLSNLGAITIMLVAPAVLPILVVLICIGLTIAGINASLRVLASFVAELERTK